MTTTVAYVPLSNPNISVKGERPLFIAFPNIEVWEYWSMAVWSASITMHPENKKKCIQKCCEIRPE